MYKRSVLFKYYPIHIKLYLLGILLFRVLKRYDKNIFKVIRFLDLSKKVGNLVLTTEKSPVISHYLYYLSPWMWRHRCLYESLLYYLGSPDKPDINIGLDIDYNGTKFGHCWISSGGTPVDKEDRKHASYYAELLSQKNNIHYWVSLYKREEFNRVGLKLPSPPIKQK